MLHTGGWERKPPGRKLPIVALLWVFAPRREEAGFDMRHCERQLS